MAEAFGLPRDTPEARSRRSAAIQAALAEAVRPPRGIVDAAARALDLAERVLDAANPNVLSDVGAALGCIRGGLTAAAVTLETNLGPLRDEGVEGILRTDVDPRTPVGEFLERVRVDDINRSLGVYYVNLAEGAKKPEEKKDGGAAGGFLTGLGGFVTMPIAMRAATSAGPSSTPP